MRSRVIKIVAACALSMSIPTVASAQSGGRPSSATDPISSLADRLSRVDALIAASDAGALLNESKRATLDEFDSCEIDSWIEAEKGRHSGVSGLEFRAGYDRKFGSGTDDFYDELYSYRNRFDAMLSWNVLRSGLIGREIVSQQAEIEGERLLLGELSTHHAEQIRTQFQLQSQLLNGYHNKIYTTQIELFESLQELLHDLRNRGQATKIELTQLEFQRKIAEGSLRENSIEVTSLLDIGDYSRMQILIDREVVDSLTRSSRVVEQSRLDEKMLGSEAAGVSYWDQASLSPYVKAQHYSGITFEHSRLTAHVGVSATLPLFSGTKSRRAEVKARSLLASNATKNTAASLSLLIEECALQLNANLERLKTAVKLEALYRVQIQDARYAYDHNQLTMRELSDRYIKLLELQIDVLELIETRESLKLKLLLTTI